jgi:LytR cell envelope-related transcriptional attenuator
MTPIIHRPADRKRYGRRRPLPALLILVVLAATSAIVWVNVLHQAANSTVRAVCPAGQRTPTKLPTLTPLVYAALNNVVPAPAGQVKVRVLNASTQSGLAARVDSEFHVLGFVQAAPPADDPRYPLGDMRCFGQIRFGPNGVAAARTVSIVAPCAQLVRDNRQDASVDIALGSYSNDLAPTSDAKQVLTQLAAWAAKHPTATGGLQAQNGQQPAVSAALLAGAHTFQC